MLTIVNLTGHLGNALYAVGSGFRNPLHLRAALVLGAVFEIIYDFLVAETPLWTPIIWSGTLIGINVYQIVRLLCERQFLQLSGDEARLYRLVGKGMGLPRFRRFIRSATWEQCDPGKTLIVENRTSQRLFLLAGGEAAVIAGGKPVAKIREGNFVGEMSFLTGKPTAATVSIISAAKVAVWDADRLTALLEKDPDLRHEIHRLFTGDLILKLTSQSRTEAA